MLISQMTSGSGRNPGTLSYGSAIKRCTTAPASIKPNNGGM
jgi:hypothetical protein